MSIASRSVFLCLSVLLAVNAYAACDEPVLTQLPDVTVGFNPLAIALVDFDKDGNLDLATPRNSQADGYSVWVQYGNGDGTFDAGVPYAAGERYPVRLIAADVNGDTWPDLVTANYDASSFGVLLNDGDGTFAAPQLTSTVLSPARLVAGDANGDGKLDIGVVGIVSAQVHFGNGNGTFTGTKVLTFDGYPLDLAFGDFDGSGTTDIAVYGKPPNYGPPTIPDPSTVTLHFRAGNGTYTTSKITEAANSEGVLLANDLNGDGKDDLIAGHGHQNTLTVHLRSGSSFTATDYAVGSVVNELGLADISEDGKDDLVVATGNTGIFPIFLGNGDGTFGQPEQTAAGGSALQGLGLGDVDSDFRTDIVLGDSAQDEVHIFRNDCSPRYAGTMLTSSPNPSIVNQGFNLTATISVNGTIDPTGTVSFYEGDALLGTVSVNPAARTATLLISNATTGQHTYTATYNGDSEFGESTDTHSHTVTLPPFGAPSSFTATGNPNGEVFMQWIGTQDAVEYEVLRQVGGTWSVIGSTGTTSLLFTPGSGSWFYAVRGVNGTGARSGQSVDLASTVAFTYPTLAAGSIIHGADVIDLRSIIDAFRSSAGLGAYTFTDPSLSGAVMKAVHVTDLRIGLSQAMSQAGMNPPTFGRSITTGLVILANDLLEIRTKIR